MHLALFASLAVYLTAFCHAGISLQHRRRIASSSAPATRDSLPRTSWQKPDFASPYSRRIRTSADWPAVSTSTAYRLEKFYHHWFTSDVHITELVEELGESRSRRLPSDEHGHVPREPGVSLEHAAGRAALYAVAVFRSAADGQGGGRGAAGARLESAGSNHGRTVAAANLRRPRVRSGMGAAAGRKVRPVCRQDRRRVVLEQAQAARRQPRQRRRRESGVLPGRLRGAVRTAGRTHSRAGRRDLHRHTGPGNRRSRWPRRRRSARPTAFTKPTR